MRNLKINRIVMTILMTTTLFTLAALALTSNVICLYVLGAIALCMVLCNIFFPISHRILLNEQKVNEL